MNASDFGRRALFAAACICVALNCYLVLRPQSFGWNLGKALRNPNEVMHIIGPVDRLYVEFEPHTNSVLTFKNFGPENEHLAEMLYYRSCYAAYPNKVFAAPPGTVINSAHDLLAAPFDPNDQWLDGHRVGRGVIYEQELDGRIKASVMGRDLP